MQNKGKERIFAFDFIRAILAIGIVCFHYSCHLLQDTKIRPFYTYANGDWGTTIVTAFFIISGAMLYYNNDDIVSLKKFYYKRWKTIFPMFYIAFTWFFLQNVFTYGKLFYKGNPKSIILSLLGMDGYFLYKYDNYYILGEWFLGAIIILYAMYPIILKMFNKSNKFVTVACLFLWIWQMQATCFSVDSFRNIISCLVSFVIGMFISKYALYKNNICIAISFAMFVIVLFVKLPIHNYYSVHICGLGLFFVMYYIGNKLIRLKTLSKVVMELSNLSFPIFLLQHLIVVQIIAAFKPTSVVCVMVFMFIACLLTIIEAKMLSVITKEVLNSNIYLFCENKLKLK